MINIISTVNKKKEMSGYISNSFKDYLLQNRRLESSFPWIGTQKGRGDESKDRDYRAV